MKDFKVKKFTVKRSKEEEVDVKVVNVKKDSKLAESILSYEKNAQALKKLTDECNAQKLIIRNLIEDSKAEALAIDGILHITNFAATSEKFSFKDYKAKYGITQRMKNFIKIRTSNKFTLVKNILLKPVK